MPTYVDSAAAGTNAGTSWTNAYTSIASTTGVAAGTEIWCASSHDQDFATNTTLTWSNGTVPNPVRILSINKADDTLLAGAQITTSSGSLRFSGNIITDGLIWEGVSTIDCNISSGNNQIHDNLTIKQVGSGIVSFGGTGSGIALLRNLTIDMSSATGDGVKVDSVVGTTIINGLTYYTRGAGQTNAFGGSQSSFAVQIEDANIGSVTNILEVNNLRSVFALKRATLGTYTNLLSMTTPAGATVIIEASVGGTLSVPPLGLTYYAKNQGYVSSSLSRYRTGGADDGEQANAHSWEITSNANTLESYVALKAPPIVRWVASGSQTLTVYVASGVTLQDDEFWIEVSSPDEGGTPTAQGTLNSTRLAPRGTPANLTTDSISTWTGTGVGTKQKIDVAINPAVAGPVVVRAFLAKPSTTVYVDPKLGVA